MAIGSVLLGGFADKHGRRPAVFLCLGIMASGMGLAAFASDVVTMSIYRLYTGVGIGGMLATTNALVAEHSNRKRRSLAITVMTMGYPLGAIFGGMFAARLLATSSWHSIFIFGAIVTAVCIPLVWFLLPETIQSLDQRRPANALARTNSLLSRLGHAPVEQLPPEPAVQRKKVAIRPLFEPELFDRTVLLCLAFFFHIMTFYFILKWIPKIVVDMGYEASLAAGVLVWANVGGLLGALSIGLLTQRLPLRPVLVGGLVLAAVMVTLFGRVHSDIAGLSVAAALAGFCTNACVSGYYALLAHSFPAKNRAAGTGMVIGVGRGGSAMGPVIAGFLFAAGFGLQSVALVMGAGSFISALVLIYLGVRLRRKSGANEAWAG